MLASTKRLAAFPTGWIAEPKFDGWRIMIVRHGGRLVVWSRRGSDLTDQLPELAKAFKINFKKVDGKTATSYTMDHSAGSYIFDGSGRVRLYHRYGSPIEGLTSDVRILLKG